MKLRTGKNPLNNYIAAIETCNDSHHASAILLKNNIVIKRTEPVEKETDSNERSLEIIDFHLSWPFMMVFR